MDRVNAMFGSYKGFDKACIISKLPDGIRESPNHKDLFMVYSNSSNYRIVDMSVCKCSCPNEKICSHIISILIRYSNTQRNYINRLLILKELEKIKSYSNSKQLDDVMCNLHNIFYTLSSKHEVIESVTSLIVGLYHRFLTKFVTFNHSNNLVNNSKQSIKSIKSNVIDKSTQSYSIFKSHKLGYLASLTNHFQNISDFNNEIITSIRLYNNNNTDIQLDQMEFNKACMVYSKLSSSRYISINPNCITSSCVIDHKQLVNIIKMIPPLTELSSATNWRLNFYPSFGPLLEFVTTHMDEYYLVTSHNTIYPLKLSDHNIHSINRMIDINLPIEQLASTVLYLLYNDNIDPHVKHLQQLFMNCTIDKLLNFIAIVPIELINTIYDIFLGNILLNRNLTLDGIRFNKNLVINLYIAHKMGYLPNLSHGFLNYHMINKPKFDVDILKHENHVSINISSPETIKLNKPISEYNESINVTSNNHKDNNVIIDSNDAKFHIECIRRDKYGIGTDQCKNEYILQQNDRLSRILDKLSNNLYPNINNILYELIQNADDNYYSHDTTPELIILQTEHSVTLFNNEIGFSKVDIESICDLANSSKIDNGRFCTGKYGIGFKSVFAITNEPHIFSNGYQFKFTSYGIGKLIPQWVDDYHFLNEISELANIDSRCYNTIIYLPLIRPLQFDISYNLILHLRKIKSLSFIQITDDCIKSEINMKVTTEIISETPFIFKKIFYNDQVFNYIQYNDINSNIQLTFPIESITTQFVYSTLPVGVFGMNFAINSKFNLTLDRSNLIDDEYNRLIIERIPVIFLNSLDVAKKLDRKIYYSILSTFPRNATGIFSVLNSRFNELFNQSDIIPTNMGYYVKPSESIYLTNKDDGHSQLGVMECYLKTLIIKGYIKSFIPADDIPHNIAMILNLPICDFWNIIRLFEQFTKDIDTNETEYAVYVLKIVQFFINRNVNMKKQLIEVVQRFIRFPYMKDTLIGFDNCTKIYIGEPKLYRNLFQLLPLEITEQFSNDFLLEVGFNNVKDVLNNITNLNDIDLPQDLKFAISVDIIKSVDIRNGIVNNVLDVSLPIYGAYSDNCNNEISSIPFSSYKIVPFDHEFYDLLIQRGYNLFIPNNEYQPQLSRLLLNNISNHLKHLLELVQMDTNLAVEYFKFIKYLLSVIDKMNLNIDIGDLLVPIGKWIIIDHEIIWEYECLVSISCTNSIKYFTKTPPEIINNQFMDPKTLLLLLKLLQNGDTLYKTHQDIQYDYILLGNIANMWVNRSFKSISNALLEVLDSIYNQLSSFESIEDILVEISESQLIYTKFQNTLTAFNVNDVFINCVDDLNLPIEALSQIYTVDKSFWKLLNILETPSLDRLIELIKCNSSLTIKSIISIVVYLYQNMDNDKFVLTVSNLNIIPGWYNHIKNKEIQSKISLLKPTEISVITQCADLSLFGMEKIQNLWHEIIENLTKLKYNTQINDNTIYEHCNEDDTDFIDYTNNQTNYYDKYRIDVGLSGEKIVYDYLLEKYGTSVKWLNESGEQGLPYDITFFKDGIEKFVEVKSSHSCTKKVFEISHSEWLFAQIKSEDFIIYRVNAVKSENPLITILPNPYYLWKNKKIAFCLSL